jgi:hypothetical protein
MWTTPAGHFSPTTPTISAVGGVAHMEPRLLLFSRIVASCRVISRLIETRKTLFNDLGVCRAKIVSKHELKERAMRRRRIELRRRIENQNRLNCELESEIASLESKLFHKRNNLSDKQSQLKSLETTITGPPLLAANLEHLRRNVESQRIKKMSKIAEIFPIEQVGKSYSIRGLIFNKQVFDMRDEEGFSTALGHVVNCLMVASSLCDASARSGLVFSGSRSSIIDFVSIADLPLYFKDTDRTNYSRAVELLHDVVIELLAHSGCQEPKRSSDLLYDLKRLLYQSGESVKSYL